MLFISLYLLGIIFANLLGTPLDSMVFVTLAFGLDWQAIVGQTVVKFLSSLAVLLIPAIRSPLQTENAG